MEKIIMYAVKERDSAGGRFWDMRIGASNYPELFNNIDTAVSARNVIEREFLLKDLEIVPYEIIPVI